MPSFIAPIEHTRSFSLKPAEGLRYGNFEGVVNLPPVIKTKKLGEHSFSTLNNQQIYKTICEWYEGWRAWQQKILLCGIVDRCSTRQVDILATTLEPIRHRDYVVAAGQTYPISPLKKVREAQPHNRRKKKKVKRKETQKHQDHVPESLIDGSGIITYAGEALLGAETPVSVIEPDPTFFTPRVESDLLKKLTFPHESSENHARSKEFTTLERDYSSVSGFADTLATRIVEESLPRTISVFEPSELYAQDLASSILQQALDNVGNLMNEKAKSIESKARLDEQVASQGLAREDAKNNNIDIPVTDKRDAVHQEKDRNDKLHRVKSRADLSQPIDFSLLDKYKKYTPPPKPKHDKEQKDKRPKSLVRLVIPDHDTGESNGQERRLGSAHSGVSKSLSVITRSSLENMRYKLFATNAISTPDFFKVNGVTKLPGGHQHLRYGMVRQPHGIHNIPVPVARMYKNIKWWTENEREGRIMLKAEKEELKLNFKEQLDQVWDWMNLWEDFEKIALLKELLKLCVAEDLNFICSHIQQRVRDTRDVNRLPDKLLLYIFSFLDAPKIHKAARVCRRWRFLCATDDLWMIKCHELGLKEGIQNLEKMIVKAKGYRMVIDWRMAYEELQRITQMMKIGFMKKKPKVSKKGRNVEFKAELEKLKSRDEKNKRIPSAQSFSDLAEFELEVLRGTLSSIRRQEQGQHGDENSVISEDLREYDDEFKLQWEDRRITKPQSKVRDSLINDDTEVTTAAEGTMEKIKRMQKGTEMSTKPSMLKRRKTEMADDADAEDAAFDIRPELMPADDILGKAKSSMSLQWHQVKKKHKQDSDDDDDDDYYRPRRTPRFVGEVKSVLRARKLQGHMSGITCIQYDTRRLISAGLDRVIRMWDIRSGRSLHKFYGHKGGIRCMVFVGNELLTGSWDTTIMIWDLRNLCRKYILTDHTDSVTCLAMNQEFVVSGSEDWTVRVWRRASYLCCNVLRGHKGPVTSVAFDGTHAISGSLDRTLRMTNIITGDCVRTFTDCDAPILSVTMKGSLILSSDKSGRVHFWNKLNGECEAAIQAHQEPVNKISYLEGRFYTASTEWSIREWDLVTMTSVRLLQGHKGPVKDLKVTSDRIVSCSEDGSIRIWDLFDPRKKTTEAEQIQQLNQDGLS